MPRLSRTWLIGPLLVLACAETHEPRAAPIVARRTGGDSLQPGPMVIVCKADDEACVPSYAVACQRWVGDSAPLPGLPALSDEERGLVCGPARAGLNPALSRPSAGTLPNSRMQRPGLAGAKSHADGALPWCR